MISHSLALKLGPFLGFEKNCKPGLSVNSELGKGSTFYFFIESKIKTPSKLELINVELNSENESEIGENLNDSEEQNLTSINIDKKFLELEKQTYSTYTLNYLNSKKDFSSVDNLLDNKKFITNFNERKSYSMLKFKKCECAHFLVVDDNDFNLMCLAKLLEQCGFVKCEFAYNGQEAIEMVKNKSNKKNCIYCEKYEIIFMDCEMPVKNGFEATAEIIQLEKNKKIPNNNIIIATTAGGTLDEISNCLNSGMKDYILKPITQQILKEVINKWVGIYDINQF